MDKKYFTKLFLETAELDASEPSIKTFQHQWWYSPLSASSLRLSSLGNKFLSETLKLHQHKCKLKPNYAENLKLILLMNKYLSSPFYFPRQTASEDKTKFIITYGETDALMLLLMDGDLETYLQNFTK